MLCHEPCKAAFNVVSTVVQSKYSDQVAVTVSWKHESAQIDEVFPPVVQQVSQTAHLGIHNTDMSPIYLKHVQSNPSMYSLTYRVL